MNLKYICSPTGPYTITATYKGKITNGIQNFSLIISGAKVSDWDVTTPIKFYIYYNPTNENINIEGELNNSAYYSILSSYGTTLKKGKADFESINVDDLSSGFYSLTIFEDGKEQSVIFIKN